MKDDEKGDAWVRLRDGLRTADATSVARKCLACERVIVETGHADRCSAPKAGNASESQERAIKKAGLRT